MSPSFSLKLGVPLGARADGAAPASSKAGLATDGSTVGSPRPRAGGYGFTSWPRAELAELPAEPLCCLWRSSYARGRVWETKDTWMSLSESRAQTG